MNFTIKRAEGKEHNYFPIICDWQYNWWGKTNRNSFQQVERYMENSMCFDKIPQTYIAFLDDIPVGMYQIQMYDLDTRPDLYPWLVNVYVDEQYRGQGICSKLMNHAIETFRNLKIEEVFLYTKHINLYEKYGWEFIGEVETFKEDSPIERLYQYKI